MGPEGWETPDFGLKSGWGFLATRSKLLGFASRPAMFPVAIPMAWEAGAETNGISLSCGVSAEEPRSAVPVMFENV